MTTRVCLHVGSPKSGTTYLQQVMEHNRSALADAGVLVAGRHVERVHAAMAVREDPRLERLRPRQQQSWPRLVEQVRAWKGDTAVISYELFAGATAEQAARALRDLEGLDVHVVITSRDLGTALPSAWQERLKFGLTRRLEKWAPPPESQVRSEWGWRTMDPAGVAGRWGAGLPADHVHVVTVPRTRTDPHELWHRFAQACGIGDLLLDLEVGRANESLGLVEAELLRRVNGRLRPPLTSDNREQALWLRDTLAHGVLAGLGNEPIGITDPQLAEATRVADAAVEAITAAGYDVQGDLDDLRASRREARLPGDADDAELLDSALEAIVSLLLLVRERSRSSAPEEEDEPEQGVRRLAGRALRRTVAPYVARRDDALRARISALEAEVDDARALHLRVAALQDVVTELLLPAAQQDRRVTRAALRTYRQDSL